MPASYVHILSASRAVLKWSPENTKINLNAVLAGAEGPDPLFYMLSTPKGQQKLPAVAGIMHKTQTGAFLRELAKNCEGSTLLRSYLYGFLSHYATDTVCHPYIFTKSFNKSDGKYNSDKHCKFEHAIDVYMYRRQGFVKGLPRQAEGFAKLSSAEKQEIAAALTKSINAVYTETPVEEKTIKKSFGMEVFLCRLLRNAGSKKHSLMLAIALKTKGAGLVDSHLMPNVPVTAFEGGYSVSGHEWSSMLNNEHKVWHSYWEQDRDRTESFDELFKAAVERSAEFMAAAEKYFEKSITEEEFAGIIGDMSFDSGLPWKETTALDPETVYAEGKDG